MLPWKVQFALASGARAGKAQVCLGTVSVAGTSVAGGRWRLGKELVVGRSKVVCIMKGLKYHKKI